MGLVISCISIFVVLFMAIHIDYIDSVQTLKYVEWDFNTITSADYTVVFEISDE